MDTIFNNTEYTYFPTNIKIVYQRDTSKVTSWSQVFIKGTRYTIPDPRFLENRNMIEIPVDAYHPRELGYKKNIIQITRDFNTGKFLDDRDNQSYETITFKYQNGKSKTWMAENLNYKTSNSISYLNSESSRKQYGLLYRIMNDNGILIDPCPIGWSLPTLEDWNNIADKFGGREQSGKQLKSLTGFMDVEWEDGNKKLVNGYNGNNYSGMNIVPAGEYSTYKGENEFKWLEIQTSFWTKSRHFYPNLGRTSNTVFDFVSFSGWNNKASGTLNKLKLANDGRTQYYSCRCVKN